MDGYVSKPILADDLFRELSRVITASPAPLSPPQPVAGPPAETPVVDEAGLWERLDHDRAWLERLTQKLNSSSPALLAEIRAALQAGDAERLSLAAHTLKGSFSNFLAQPAVDAVLRLEQAARSGNLTDGDALAAAVENEVTRLRETLARLVAGAAGQTFQSSVN